MCLEYIVSFKIKKICLHQRDGRCSGIPYKLPQEQSQIKITEQKAEVPRRYTVVSANNSFFLKKDPVACIFHLQSLRASKWPPSKGQSVSPGVQRASP